MKINKRLQKLVNRAISSSVSNGEISEDKSRQFIKSFSKLPPYQAIPLLCEYRNRLRSVIQAGTLTIESQIPLSDIEIKNLRASALKLYNISSVEIRINTSLIGGIKVRIGDNVYDNSVKSKIDNIGRIIQS